MLMSTPLEDAELELFSDYAAEWLDAQEMRLMPTTVNNYRQITQRHLLPYLGDYTLPEISTRMLNRMYAALLDHGGKDGAHLSPRTVRACHQTASRILDSATLTGLIERNPAWGAVVPGRDLRVAPHGPTTWSEDNLREFLRCIRGHPKEALFRLAAATGMRKGELLGLSWEDVDLPSRTLTVRWAVSYLHGELLRYKPKGRRPRTLSFDETTAFTLQRERLRTLQRPRPAEDWNLVFTNQNGEPHHPDVVTRSFRAFIERCGLPRIRLHDIRHTHATVMLAHGVPLHVVSARLGHSAQVTLLYYAHVLPSSDGTAAQQWSLTFDSPEEPDEPPSHPPDLWGYNEAVTWTEAAASMRHNSWVYKKKNRWKRSTAGHSQRIIDPDSS